MTNPVNPKTVTWVNPTQATDQTGAAVSWDAATDLAGIEVQLDSVAAVSVPVALAATSFDLTSLAPYKALPAGTHAISLAVVTKEGTVSPFSGVIPFLVEVTPMAPTSVVVA
jgi:hypothetical protein